ncbi:hypothetical protein BH10BDE1_BH10BDE1_17590 [soil metagenome]
MKKITMIFALVFVSSLVTAALSPALGKTSADKVKKETVEAVDAAGAYAGERKEEFTTRMKTNIDEMDREIQALKTESAQKSVEAREATKTKIRELQVKRDELGKKYDALEKSTGKAWTRMKSGMEKAWGDVRSAYNDAKTELETKK